MYQQQQRGVRPLWTSVNHVAICVSDVGRSLGFYANVIGMKQVLRPDFDRHGAWLTFGNVDLHLIKGKPVVPQDDDLIVGHIAITVPDENMEKLRVKLQELGVPARRNISVPNPSIDMKTGRLDQAFVRDPDGYYVEFCSCESLEKYLAETMANNESKWDFHTTSSVLKMSKVLRERADKSAQFLSESHEEEECLERLEAEKHIELPDWMKEDFEKKHDFSNVQLDDEKLANLTRRRKTYADICQNATEVQLRRLLLKHDNDNPKVIADISKWIRMKGTQTYIPPAFYDRDGDYVQPPPFEMPLKSTWMAKKMPTVAVKSTK